MEISPTVSLFCPLDVTFSFPSPEWFLDSDVAVHSDSQQAENGALGEHQDETGDEQAAVEVGTEAGTDVVLQENIIGSRKER